MDDYIGPAFSLICDNLPDDKFRKALDELEPEHALSAFVLGLNSEGNISAIGILANTMEDAQSFAKALGQQATPEPIAVPDPDES